MTKQKALYFVAVVPDYHDLEFIAASFRPPMKSLELGMDARNYVGIIYRGKRPTKAAVSKLLKGTGTNLLELRETYE
jgi:hypothetical protein